MTLLEVAIVKLRDELQKRETELGREVDRFRMGSTKQQVASARWKEVRTLREALDKVLGIEGPKL